MGLICALPIELAAAQEMLHEEHYGLSQDRRDDSIYTLGRIGVHNVAMTCLPAGQIGTQVATAVATRKMAKFPSLIFGPMVGIGGGVPSEESDVHLGDVVIKSPAHAEWRCGPV